MTAPGDSVLIFILVAVFFACSGYAAGRLHQRHQSERDTEEAYKAGYEKAQNRGVFSLAARAMSPRRAARGSAAVASRGEAGGASVAAPAAHVVPADGHAP